MNKTLKIVIISTAVLISLFFLMITAIQSFFVVSTLNGISMRPTFQDQDTIVMRRYTRLIDGDIQRGTIVSFNPPGNTSYRLVKRIVGLPGDEVEIDSGKVYINGEEIVEEYIEEGVETTAQLPFPHQSHWIVPEGEVFVLGDNRRYGASDDSRNFGSIKKSDIRWIYLFKLGQGE